LTTGDHQIKVGADFNYIDDNAVWNLFFPARIVFPNLTAFQNALRANGALFEKQVREAIG
jgi:hypothetical protein